MRKRACTCDSCTADAERDFWSVVLATENGHWPVWPDRPECLECGTALSNPNWACPVCVREKVTVGVPYDARVTKLDEVRYLDGRTPPTT